MDELDVAKEATQIRKNLLVRHGQGEKVAKQANILGKRLGDTLDVYG